MVYMLLDVDRRSRLVPGTVNRIEKDIPGTAPGSFQTLSQSTRVPLANYRVKELKVVLNLLLDIWGGPQGSYIIESRPNWAVDLTVPYLVMM